MHGTVSSGNSQEYKTRSVVILTFLTMILEIVVGYYTGSMALLADGFHMASHAGALGLSWLAYILARRLKGNAHFPGGTDKILSLAGYSSALFLFMIAVIMAFECVKRFINPVPIIFKDAIIVAVIGLAVNGASAWILRVKKDAMDINIRAAYLHVLADALTSITAIIALFGGMMWNLYSLDALSGIFSSVVIAKWAIGLTRDSATKLLDYKGDH